MTALLSLVALVAPRFGERQRPSRGAGQLQSWLNLAKNRALRDQRPRGIRLPPVSDPSWPAGVAYVTEMQYIELPEVFTGGQLWVPFSNRNPNNPPTADLYSYCFLVGVELAIDPTDPNSDRNTVRPGDVLKVDSPDWEPRRIRAVTQINNDPRFAGQTIYLLTLDQDLGGPYPLNPPGQPVNQPQTRTYPSQPPPPTESYRILRGPRAMPGEPVLTLPKDVGIDISREPGPAGSIPNWYRLFPGSANSAQANPFDILFDPSGRVIGAESTLGSRICLWVRDISQNYGPTQMPDGDNTLITIYTRTGQISAHPIDPTGLNYPPSSTNPWNPFRFTQDAKSSGAQ
jgi:hypothetical protein